MYDVHFGLIRKCVVDFLLLGVIRKCAVDFLLVLIEFFRWVLRLRGYEL